MRYLPNTLDELVINKREQLYKVRGFSYLVVGAFKYAMQRRKEISCDYREADAAVHESGKGFKAVLKQFHSSSSQFCSLQTTKYHPAANLCLI